MVALLEMYRGIWRAEADMLTEALAIHKEQP